MTRAERLFARIAILQTFVSAIALIVGVAALYAALVESSAVRKQLDATVWPYMTLGPSFNVTADGQPRLNLVALNSGIGPAKIRHLRLEVDGKPVRNWNELFTALEIKLPDGYVQSQLTWRVIQSGERLDVLTLEGTPAQKLRLEGARLSWQLCYCSVFDDCYLLQSRAVEPAPVAQCPRQDGESFTQ